MSTAHRQHTPGPWVFTEDPLSRNPSLTWNINGFHPVAGFLSPQDCQLATVYDVEANARLIAAAPDLLAALTNILARVEASPTLLPHISADVRNEARAAIARATGGNAS